MALSMAFSGEAYTKSAKVHLSTGELFLALIAAYDKKDSYNSHWRRKSVLSLVWSGVV